MALPNPSMSFSPFAILTAEELNDLVENVEALADGTGLDDGAVTPEKRSGGYAIGIISALDTLGTTGNKAITGVGFKPKLVKFYILPGANAGFATDGAGAMTETEQYVRATTGGSSGSSRNSSTSGCIGWLSSGSTTWSLFASYVSMDDDGFTINVTTASTSWQVAWEAYA